MISRYPEEISARTRDNISRELARENLSPKMSFGIISLWEYSRKEISLEMTSIDHPRFSWDRIRLHLNRDLYGHLTRDDTLKDVVRDDIRCKHLVQDYISWEISLEIRSRWHLLKIDLSQSRDLAQYFAWGNTNIKKDIVRDNISQIHSRSYLLKYILLETGSHWRDRYQSRDKRRETRDKS